MLLARTVVLIAIGVLSVFFAPVWLQIVFLILIILFARPAFVAFIPALLADLAYNPGTGSLLANLKMTFIVIISLGVYWIIKTRTRLLQLYDFLEKEKEI